MIKLRKGSIPLLIACFIAFFAPSKIDATSQPGILATFYNNYWYNQSPPLPTVSGRPIVGTSVVSNINQNFDSQPVFNLYEDFIVKYEGYITSPITGSIIFWPWADDGTQFYLNNVLIDNNWRDKGGGGNMTAPQSFVAGVSQPFTYWFYENGGGAWTTLYWDIGDGWEVVPESAFTTEPLIPTTTTSTTTSTTTTTTSTTTTTTSTTTTTTSTTTTTIPQTTTTELTTTTTTEPEAPTTTQPAVLPETTLPPKTTTTSTSTTTSTTSTTVLPTTTISTPETTTTTIPKIIEETISQEEAVDVATSKEAIQEISKEDAKKVFDAIDPSEITEEEKTQIIEAVQDAPQEVKEAFEGEINIYADGFDEYVPVGSQITVKARRTLLAAIGAVSTITVAGGGVGGSSPSGGNSNSPSGSGKDSAFKKDEEEDEDEEEGPEIEGPEGGDDEVFTKNSIFKYGEEGMKKFSLWNFIKKFSKETAALAFTISSTVIVFATLSGDTRKITLIATTCAFAVHYISVMIKNDE